MGKQKRNKPWKVPLSLCSYWLKQSVTTAMIGGLLCFCVSACKATVHRDSAMSTLNIYYMSKSVLKKYCINLIRSYIYKGKLLRNIIKKIHVIPNQIWEYLINSSHAWEHKKIAIEVINKWYIMYMIKHYTDPNS